MFAVWNSKIRALVLGLSAVSLIPACSLLGDQGKPGPRKPVAIQPQAAQACVNKIPDDVKNWLKDGSHDIGQTVDCTVEALGEFTQKVVGTKIAGSYTEAELVVFLKDFLAKKDSDLSRDAKDIVTETLKLKRLLIGGSDTELSRAEFDQIREVLLRLKPSLIALTPHIPLVFFEPKSAEPGKAAAAGRAIGQLISAFSKEIEGAAGSRPTWTTKELLDCFEKLGFKNEKVKDYLPLVDTTKGILVGGTDGAISGGEWTAVLESARRVWSLALRLQYDIAQRDEWLTDGFSGVEPIVNDTISVLTTAVKTHSRTGKGVAKAKFETLIDNLAKVKALPMNMSAFALKELLPVLFGKLLYGRSNADWAERGDWFGTVQLEILKSVLSDWLEGQKVLLRIVTKDRPVTAKSLPEALAASIPANPKAKKSLEMLAYVFKYVRPLPHDELDRLIVLPSKRLPGVSQKDVSLLNAVRVAVTTVIRGYSHDVDSAKKLQGLTEGETQEVYNDIKAIGKDLNLMDVRNQVAGARSFMEGSIFTSTSDGSDYLSVTELVEWFHFVLGGGMLADKIHEGALEAGCGLPEARLDVLGTVKLDYELFSAYFAKTFDSHLANLPRMVRWIRADKTGARYGQVIEGTMKAARPRGYTKDNVDLAELRAMIPVLHYAENLFARHDVNENDTLDHEELWEAFKILAPFIKKLGAGKADAEFMQKAIFAWILSFGEPPAQGLEAGFKMVSWYTARVAVQAVTPALARDSADRSKVLKVIASFVTTAREARRAAIVEFHKEKSANLYQLFKAGDIDTSKLMAKHFQCLDEAPPILRTLLMTHASDVAPGAGITGEEFTRKVLLKISAEPELDSLCLPF